MRTVRDVVVDYRSSCCSDSLAMDCHFRFSFPFLLGEKANGDVKQVMMNNVKENDQISLNMQIRLLIKQHHKTLSQQIFMRA